MSASESPPVAAPETPSRRSVKMPQAAALKVPTPAVKKLYECGVRDGCPREQINIPAGSVSVTFSRFRGTPMIHTDGRVTGESGRGMRQELTEQQLATALANLAHKVVRIDGSGRGDVYDDRSPNYVAAEGDDRLARWVWMEEITDSGLRAETAEPAPLAG